MCSCSMVDVANGRPSWWLGADQLVNRSEPRTGRENQYMHTSKGVLMSTFVYACSFLKLPSFVGWHASTESMKLLISVWVARVRFVLVVCRVCLGLCPMRACTLHRTKDLLSEWLGNALSYA
eukprot:1938646-Amphidinium_carterae.1